MDIDDRCALAVAIVQQNNRCGAVQLVDGIPQRVCTLGNRHTIEHNFHDPQTLITKIIPF